MKILVAGATGVVGRRLVPLLVEAGHDVTGLSRSEIRAASLAELGARGATGDVLDRDGMFRLLAAEEPEIVIDEVTDIPRRLEPGKTQSQFAGNVRVRTEGTRNLVDAAQAAGVRRVVAQSYAHVYAPVGGWVKIESDPLNLFPDVPQARRANVAAIAALEKAVLETAGIEGVALRYGTFYGPGTALDPAAGSLAELVRRRHYPLVGGGTGYSSFVHVEDAATAAVLAIGGPTGIYNIGDDHPAPVSEWLPFYAHLVGAPPPRHIPAWTVRALGREPFAYRSTEQRAGDNRKARARLGFAPLYSSWRDGLARESELAAAA